MRRAAVLMLSVFCVAGCTATTTAAPTRPASPQPVAEVLLRYAAPTDRAMRPEPVLPTLGPRGSIVTDDISGFRILRVTDGALVGERPGRSWTPNDGSAEALMWNADGSRFLVLGSGGDLVPFAFDKAVFQATRMSTPGGLWYIPVGSAVWDPTDPDFLYGAGNRGIRRYDVVSRALTTVWDTSALGGAPQSLSIGNNRRIAGYIGSQDSATLAVARDLGTGQTWVLDTAKGMLNGTAIPGWAGRYGIHNVRMGQEGRYVVLTGPVLLVWDLDGGTVTPCTLNCGGHKVQGFGYLFNNDSITGSEWYQYQYLKRAVAALGSPTALVGPPFPKGGTDSHVNWGSAQAGLMAPLIVSTSGEGLGTGPVTAPYDREIIAIATDGSGTIWRLAHHRSLYQGFYDGPHATVSRDGRYVLFGSNWGRTLGAQAAGPRQDVFILELR